MAKPIDFFRDNVKLLPANIRTTAPVVYNLHHGFHALLAQVERLEAQLNKVTAELNELRQEQESEKS